METLFIIDDDETYAKILSQPLKKKYRIRICHSAEHCLQTIEQYDKPQVAVIDYYLPGMNGMELFKKLKDEYQIPKLIVLSANEDSGVVLDMIRNGVRHYVIKDEHAFDALQEALTELDGEG